MKGNPMLCILHLIAIILLIYALWVHNVWIAVIILAAGIIIHAIKYFSKKKTNRRKRR
jgi:Flp pilus assembly protein TadB